MSTMSTMSTATEYLDAAAEAAKGYVPTPEQEADAEAEEAAPVPTALDWMLRFAYGYVSESALRERYGAGLCPTPSAMARVGQITGWCVGLSQGGNPTLASALAGDFDRVFRQMARGCGETVEIEVKSSHSGEVEGTVRVPAQKVEVYDDGTFGGFSFCAYYPVTTYRKQELARELHPEAWTDDSGVGWSNALDEAGQKLRLKDTLAEYRYYRPSWATADTGPSSCERVSYGFSYNGGMLYHGPGAGETFAVTLGSVRGWSVHT